MALEGLAGGTGSSGPDCVGACGSGVAAGLRQCGLGEQGQERRARGPIEYLGLDEPQRSGDSLPKAALKSEAEPRQNSFRRGHVYTTMLNDLDSGQVWDLVEGRKEEQARELLQGLDATRSRRGSKPWRWKSGALTATLCRVCCRRQTSSVTSSISSLISTKWSTPCARPSINS